MLKKSFIIVLLFAFTHGIYAAQGPKGAQKLSKESLLMSYLLGKAPYSQTVIALIDQGANANFIDPRTGATPLMLAASAADDLRVVRLLVQNGADVRAKTNTDGHTNPSGFTALHYLTYFNNPIENFPYIVDILLRGGADIDAKDGDGNTPLHLASKRYNEHREEFMWKIQVLLSQGANRSIKNNKGQIPQDILDTGFTELRKILDPALGNK